MRIGRVLRNGWSLLRTRLLLGGILYAASAALAFLFGSLAWSWLERSLDSSLPSRTLLTDLDANVVVDLLVHHGESLRMLLGQGILVLIAGLLISVWTQAAVAISFTSDATVGESLRLARSRLGTFGLLWLLNVSVTALALAALGLILYLATKTSLVLFNERIGNLLWGTALLLGGCLVLVSSAIHEQARIHSAATDREAVQAWNWALRFTTVKTPLPMLIALGAMGVQALSYGIYWAGSELFVVTNSTTLGLSLIWGQLWLMVRIVLSL